MIRTAAAALLFAMIAAPAAAAQSFVYVATAALPCPTLPCTPGELLVYDAVTRERVTSVPLGIAGHVPQGMAIAPDGRRLYISMLASDGSASLVVFDTSRHELGSTHALPAGVAGPVAVTRDSQRVFVSGGGKLIVWNAQSATVSASLDASYNYLFAHPNLNRVIGGTLAGSFPFHSLTLTALDEVAGAGFDSAFHGLTRHVSMSLDGSRIYNASTHTLPGHIADVHIISTVSLQETGTLESCGNGSCLPRRAVDAPTRNRVYVLADGVGATPIHSYDRTTAQPLSSLTVLNENTDAVVSGDETRLWIASQRTTGDQTDSIDALGVVNLASFAFEETIPLATSPLLMAATPPPGAGRCSYTVNPRQSSWTRDGGTATITLSTGCAWQASENASWLHPAEPNATSGFGPRTFSVTVDTYFGGDASRSAPLLIGGQVVTFTQAGFGSQPAFGSFDTPQEGLTGITGALPVTGWALDDVGVTRVRIFRDAVSGEAADQVYLGDATFVDGARPDVQALAPSLPFASRAGWGYHLLTNMLPGGGTGTYRLHAYADDVDGHTTQLGSRTFTAANNTATLPFGTLDTPGQGETVSGTIIIWGWALTPQPANIPTDGSTIDVVIDDVPVGRPTYGFDRSDIAALFPGYANTNSAIGYFMLDTTTLTNGVHSVSWVVRDSMGRAAGIGSRYFTVQNP